MPGDFGKLMLRARTLADEIKNLDDFVVVGHIDVDGITSTAITVRALQREGKKVQFINLKQLYSEDFKKIEDMGKHIIFVDFGSGQLKDLQRGFNKKFYIIDHHQPVDLNYPEQLNPLTFGFDGGSEVSGAGMCYFFALALNEMNQDMAYLALTGALGDMQDSKGGIKGLNIKLIEKAVELKQISVTKDLRLYGRFTRPLISFLQFSGNPNIPGISANELGCIELLKEQNIPFQVGETWRVYNDLEVEEKKRLISALMIKLVEGGAPDWEIKMIFGDVYTKLDEQGEFLQDLKEFGTMLNSVGRHGEAEIGVEICLGDRATKYHYAVSKVKEHRQALASAIEWLSNENLHEEELYYWFDAKETIESTIVGIVAGMILGSEIALEHKAIFGFAQEGEFAKVSGRTTWRLVNKGMNLGGLMHEACDELGNDSEGGGHAIAAGARIPQGSEKKFLELAEKIIKRQIK